MDVGQPHHPYMIGEQTTKYKLIFVGDNGVGKTAVIQRYFNESFEEKAQNSTISCDYKIRNLKLKWEDQKSPEGEQDKASILREQLAANEIESRVRLYVWDTAGQERFRHITRNYYNSSSGIFVCFDLTAPKTFDSVENFWMRDLDKFAPENAVRFLVACKADREDEPEKRQALQERAKKFAADNENMVYMECSAKSKLNIEAMFDQMAHRIYEEEISRMENDSLLKFRESSICRESTDSTAHIGSTLEG